MQIKNKPAVEYKKPTVAITHDYLTQRGGAERVVLAMHRAFPEAVIYTTLYSAENTYPEFKNATIVTSQLNKVDAFRKDHRSALPFLALASSMMNIPEDIVIASSSGWAHGFKAKGKIFVYCHSPARWLYLTEQYLGMPAWKSRIGWALTAIRPFLKLWDRRAAKRATKYVGNSTVVQQRIKDVYGIEAGLLYPPHSIDISGSIEPIEGLQSFIGVGGHYLVVSRLLPYKNVDKAIEAFRGLDEKLLVIGAGPLSQQLEQSSPENVRFASNLSDAQMRWAYASSRALIAPSYEDFGITPLESGAWGKPTIALRAGGYLDTIIEGVTGVFIEEPTSENIRKMIKNFDNYIWDSNTIKNHVNSFSEDKFNTKLQEKIIDFWKEMN